MKKSFTYDTVEFIELIKSRPCLWDKTADSFKVRKEKKNAWKEIYVALEEDFFEKDKREQQRIAELINGKWQNIRDAFSRSLKTRSTRATARKYVYHDNLQFLIKSLIKDKTMSNIDDLQDINFDSEELEPEVEFTVQDEHKTDNTSSTHSLQTCNQAWNSHKKTEVQENIHKDDAKSRYTKIMLDEDETFFISRRKDKLRKKVDKEPMKSLNGKTILEENEAIFTSRRKEKLRENVEKEPAKSSNTKTVLDEDEAFYISRRKENVDKEPVNSLNTKTMLDEDEAFFISITPSVQRMPVDDKLEFRMSVLQLLRDLNNRSRKHPASVPLYSSANSPGICTSTPVTQYNTSIGNNVSPDLSVCLQEQPTTSVPESTAKPVKCRCMCNQSNDHRWTSHRRIRPYGESPSHKKTVLPLLDFKIM